MNELEDRLIENIQSEAQGGKRMEDTEKET